jgi:hypothetical protein
LLKKLFLEKLLELLSSVLLFSTSSSRLLLYGRSRCLYGRCLYGRSRCLYGRSRCLYSRRSRLCIYLCWVIFHNYNIYAYIIIV